jgi:hypothetical protein
MKFLNKFKLLNFVLYIVISYQFFKVLWPGWEFDSKNSVSNLEVGKSGEKDIATEKKCLIDLKYKRELYFGEPNFPDRISIILDTENKVIGCRFSNSYESLAEHFCLNKKFLHSTLLGSIKLIKL